MALNLITEWRLLIMSNNKNLERLAERLDKINKFWAEIKRMKEIDNINWEELAAPASNGLLDVPDNDFHNDSSDLERVAEKNRRLSEKRLADRAKHNERIKKQYKLKGD